MSERESLTNIPLEDVPKVVKSYMRNGAKEIKIVKNVEGNWDVIALLKIEQKD